MLKKNGINIGGENACIHSHADDIVPVSENEQDVPDMLAIQDNWCEAYCMTLNVQKSKSVHLDHNL